MDEWRGLREGHPYQGRSLSWLQTHERLLVLELAMLEEHGLTLPPEKEPLRGFGRRGQTSWRWTALDDTRTALRRRKLLRWVRRMPHTRAVVEIAPGGVWPEAPYRMVQVAHAVLEHETDRTGR